MPEAAVAPSVNDAIVRGARRLAEAGCETPRLDAELLVAEALQLSRARLVTERDRLLDAEELPRLGGLVRRRCVREPVAYILGRKDFRHLTLQVDPRVLIPRPETELLVEVGLTLGHGARVVDVGTGSGAIALALKDERPDLEVWGSDVSEPALEVARSNAQRLGLEVRFVQSDLLQDLDEPFDAVLANLPYVETSAELAPEISQFEPQGALYAGADGLDLIRRLVEQLAGAPLAALEVGAGQASAVEQLLRAAGFASVERVADLAGHERAIVGRR